MTRSHPRRGRGALGILLVFAALICVASPVAAQSFPHGRTSGHSLVVDAHRPQSTRWPWPVRPPTVLSPYRAPATDYGAGHRGVDLSASDGRQVVSPADGVVTFSGTVVDRPVITIRTREGLRISMEPVRGPARGTRVLAGDDVGVVARGGHCDDGCLHVGVRRGEEYLSPMTYFASVARAVLLPLKLAS